MALWEFGYTIEEHTPLQTLVLKVHPMPLGLFELGGNDVSGKHHEVMMQAALEDLQDMLSVSDLYFLPSGTGFSDDTQSVTLQCDFFLYNYDSKGSFPIDADGYAEGWNVVQEVILTYRSEHVYEPPAPFDPTITGGHDDYIGTAPDGREFFIPGGGAFTGPKGDDTTKQTIIYRLYSAPTRYAGYYIAPGWEWIVAEVPDDWRTEGNVYPYFLSAAGGGLTQTEALFDSMYNEVTQASLTHRATFILSWAGVDFWNAVWINNSIEAITVDVDLINPGGGDGGGGGTPRPKGPPGCGGGGGGPIPAILALSQVLGNGGASIWRKRRK